MDEELDPTKTSHSQEEILQHGIFAPQPQEVLTPLSTNESSSSQDEIPLAITGITICSPPDESSSGEEEEEEKETEEVTPQPDMMNLDDQVSVTNHVDDGNDVDAVDGDQVGTADLGMDINASSVLYEENSLLGFETPGTVPISDVYELCEDETLEMPLEKNLESKTTCSLDPPVIPEPRDIESISTLGHSKGDTSTNDPPVVPEPRENVVTEDLPEIAFEKEVDNGESTDKVLEVDNPQPDAMEQDDNNKGLLGASEKAKPSDIPMEIASLKHTRSRKLPNWGKGVADEAIEESNQSESSKTVTREKNLDTGGKSNGKEVENLNQGGVRFVEDGSDHGRKGKEKGKGKGKEGSSVELPNSVEEGLDNAMLDDDLCGNCKKAIKACKLDMGGRKMDGESKDSVNARVRLIEEFLRKRFPKDDPKYGGKTIEEVMNRAGKGFDEYLSGGAETRYSSSHNPNDTRKDVDNSKRKNDEKISLVELCRRKGMKFPSLD